MTKSMTTTANVCAMPLALLADFHEIELSDRECLELNKLNGRNIVVRGYNNDSYSFVHHQSGGSTKSFLAWRRRLLYSASFFLAIEIAIILYSQCGGGALVHARNEVYSSSLTLALQEVFGKILEPLISFLPAASSLVAAMSWTKYRRSRAVLSYGWALSMFLVLWQNHLFNPIYSFLLVKVGEEEVQQHQQEINPTTLALIAEIAAIKVLPIGLALVSGLELGAKRLYFFAPSPLTGAMIVQSAIFAIIIPFATLTLIAQLYGDTMLLVGCCLFGSGPIWTILNYHKFTSSAKHGDDASSSPHLHESIRRNKRLQQSSVVAATILHSIGLGIIFLWVSKHLKETATKVDAGASSTGGRVVTEALLDSLDKYYAVTLGFLQLLAGFLGNMMLQTIFWTDRLLLIAQEEDMKIQKLMTDLYGGGGGLLLLDEYHQHSTLV